MSNLPNNNDDTESAGPSLRYLDVKKMLTTPPPPRTEEEEASTPWYWKLKEKANDE